jgi:hypothetical protein
MKNHAKPEKRQEQAAVASSDKPLLEAVHAEMLDLRRSMVDDRGRLERQRRRVDALLWGGNKGTDARQQLDWMERKYALKEVYLDHLIDVTGVMSDAPRLHPYDLEQRAHRFGISGDTLRTAVAKVGPDIERVEVELADLPHPPRSHSMNGAAVPSKRGRAQKREKSHG